MPIPLKTPLRQVCTKCNWKNDYLITGDVILSHYSECPECGAKVITREITFSEKIQFALQSTPFFK